MDIKEKHNMILSMIKEFDQICRDNNIWYTLTSGSILGAIRHKGFIPWDTDMDVFIKIHDIDKLRKVLKSNISKEIKLNIWDEEENYPLCFDRLSYKYIDHDLVHLDIFPLIGAPSTYLEQKIFTNLCFYSFKILKTKHTDTKYSNKKNRMIIRLFKIFTSMIPDSIIKNWYYYLEEKYNFEESCNVYTIASGYGIKECIPKRIILKTMYTDFENISLPIPIEFDQYLTRIYGDYMTPRKSGYKK